MKFDPEKLDRKIRELSRSGNAPSEFLEAELRRLSNRDVILYGEITPGLIESSVGLLEKEYQCYFDRKNFVKGLQPGPWEVVYADADSDPVDLLRRNDIKKVLERLGFSEEIVPVSELNNVAVKFLIGTGFLYPVDGENVVVHPNMPFAQSCPHVYRGATFLSRDLHRGPYLELEYDRNFSFLQEFWEYWKDLAALAAGGIAQQVLFLSAHYKGLRELPPEVPSVLELGRKLVPNRYIQLEPTIEEFGWIMSE